MKLLTCLLYVSIALNSTAQSNTNSTAASDTWQTNSVQVVMTLTPQDQWAIQQIRAASSDTNITSLSITNLQKAWFDQSRTNQTIAQIKGWLANGVNVFSQAPTDKQAQVLQALSITNSPPQNP